MLKGPFIFQAKHISDYLLCHHEMLNMLGKSPASLRRNLRV